MPLFACCHLSCTPGTGGLTRLVRLEDRIADAFHGFARDLLSLLGAAVEDIPNLLWMGLKLFAACLDRLDPLHQSFGHFFFAVDAADGGGAAVAVNAGDGIGRRK